MQRSTDNGASLDLSQVKLASGKVPLSYGSMGTKEFGFHLPEPGNLQGRRMANNSELETKSLRVITASSVRLPPEKWYKRLYIPGLVSSRPSSYSNAVHTRKYTILNFLVKNLWEQFHRLANIYFLFIALLNFVPAVQAVGAEIAFLPLVFVLLVTAVKDIFEDYRRFKSDREVNTRKCKVYSQDSKKFVLKHWSSVCVGDFVRLSSDEVIPADLLFLQSSDPGNICYIETANIDGETNLKQRQVPPGSFPSGVDMGTRFNPKDFTGRLYCEPPHSKIYDFNGYIETTNGNSIGVNRNNLLLRGCVIRNTRTVVGIVVYAGHETKSMLNNSGPRAKRSKLERTINVDILSLVMVLFVLSLIGAIYSGIWTAQHLDSNIPYFPFTSDDINVALESFVRFWTFIIIYQVIIPISLYVTIEVVKFIQVYFINWDKEMYYAPTDQPFQCRALNITEDLGQIQYIFSDKTGTLTENQMSFRCCSVGGVDYPHSLMGDLTKVNDSRTDTDDLHEITDVSDIPDEEVDFPQPPVKRTILDPDLQSNISDPTVKDFFMVMAICNTVVVSSSTHQNRNETEDIPQPQNENEPASGVADLCELKYEAESPDEAALVEAARDYGYILLSRSPHECSLATPGGEIIEYDILHVLEFDSNRKCMSIIVRQKGHSEIILYSKGADSVIYSNLRNPTRSGSLQESGFVDPDTLSFPSSQVSDPGQPPDLNTVAVMRDRTQCHLNDYAKLGLRTLCLAKRVLSVQEYNLWLEERHRAEVALEDRDKLLFESACGIECQLQLLGATGIEDQLQTGVPEAIASLQTAGIRIWVLTGDKQETAINIGYSSHLIDSDADVIILNAYSLDECNSELVKIRRKLSSQEGVLNHSGDSDSSFQPPDSSYFRLLRFSNWRRKCNDDDDRVIPRTLIIDGSTLHYALDPSIKLLFRDVAVKCLSVICCRVTPLQKAAVVDLVKCSLGKMTLAIGDGANDVSMIQKADVGVGIIGKEGMQAVMASDFAMARFHFLVRLLLVHGHWCYGRLSRLILYFFYKNMAYATILFWYQIFNAFSGSSPIDSVNLFLFNLIYTSLPIGVVGIIDQDLPAHVLLKEKTFYRQGQCSEIYTHFIFWLTVLDGLYQSAVVFFVALGAYYFGDVGIAEFGFLLTISIVIVASLHLAIETRYWTIVNHIILWGSIVVTFAFNYAYCAIDTKQQIIDTLFVMQRASMRSQFWFVLLLTPAIALLPRFLVKVIKQTLCPSPVNAARAKLGWIPRDKEHES